jgi:tubulin polyglutamylase TTLL4
MNEINNTNETNNLKESKKKKNTTTSQKDINLTNNINTLNNTNTKNLLVNPNEAEEELIPPRPELDEIESQNIKLLFPSEEGPGHPRTIFFLNDPEINSNKKSQLLNLTQIDIDQKRYMITYKAYRNIPQSLSGVMKYNQIIKSKLYTNTNLIWKLLDKDKMYPLLRKLNKYQRYNHFPICWQLGRKDNLYINYLKMQKKFKDDYNYMPFKYILPQDRDTVQEIMKEYNIFNIKEIYIVKPLASTHGKGVRILTDSTTVPTKGILEKYIYNPHLINRRKYDMRIYVLVTGFRPLKIYIYDNGIIRFCSEKYTTDAEKLNNNYIHVTNYSVNKALDILRKGEKEIDFEIKWSLLALKGYFLEKKLISNQYGKE